MNVLKLSASGSLPTEAPRRYSPALKFGDQRFRRTEKRESTHNCIGLGTLSSLGGQSTAVHFHRSPDRFIYICSRPYSPGGIS